MTTRTEVRGADLPPITDQQPLPAVLRANAARWTGRVALRHKDLGKWCEYSWADYADRTARTGLGLLAVGVQPGDKVAIIGENRPEWLWADLGAQGIGAVSVGVYSTSPAAEVEYILEHSGSVVAVVEDEEQLDKVLQVRERLPLLRQVVLIEPRGSRTYLDRGDCITFDALLDAVAGADTQDFWHRVDRVDMSETAIIVYTSGTTGPPKGAMLTHANIASLSQSWQTIWQAAPDDELLSYLPLCHVLERALSGVVSIASGYRVSFGGGGESLISDLREVQPTLFVGVPRVWEKMLASVEIRMADASWLKRTVYHTFMARGRALARKRLTGTAWTLKDRLDYAIGWTLLFRPLRDRLGISRVRGAGSGAAPIAPQVLEFFWALGVSIQEGYGQTEGSALATWNPMDAARIGTVGIPVPGATIRIADDGEILVKGPGVFAGYYRNEQATRETVDDDGWLHSGDVGVLDAEGYLTITDRKKDLIITAGGKNIAPSWIENMLKVSPYVREAIVIGDRRKFVSALIGIELDTVGDWATRQRIPFTTYKDLSERPEVRKLIQEWVDKVNADLAQVEQVKRFALLPKELDHEEGELTATQKVKRRAIASRFEELVEGMYR
ncbi:MAG: AMP-binding protein [Gemmatimonadetes bacterium]|nr:AMP-binding protein [Gemmatimonadota bacterium]